MTHLPADLPSELRRALSGYSAVPQTIGQSQASVLRLNADGRPPLFLKFELLGPFCELPGEAKRLTWLADMGMPAPRVVARLVDADRAFLLMTAVPGLDLASQPGFPTAQAIEIVAASLRRLHAMPATACPFDRRLDRVLLMAEQRLVAGVVDESDFDEERLGQTAGALFDQLLASRPADEDIVVCHGDACLPNFIVADTRFSGFVDCGRLGCADRQADLALAARSLQSNFGVECTEALCRAYGTEPDPERIAFYQLLDEFF